MYSLILHEALDQPDGFAPERDFRTQITALEQAMKMSGEKLYTHSSDIGLKHFIANGLYVRRVLIPKGLLCTTQIHLQEHLAVVLSGDCSVLTESGEPQRIVGPQIFVTKPGTKRLIYAHEDTDWVTVHAWSGSDVDEAERELAAATYEQAEEKLKMLEAK